MKSQTPMRQRSDQHASAVSGGASSPPSEFTSIDPLFHLLCLVPFSFLRPPRIRLKVPSSITLPSPMTVFSLVLLTYFAVVSGIVYDVIVEPPGIGSVQDPVTRTVKPVVFLPGRVNGQYIIEGLSSGFMFVLGGLGIIFMDQALDRSRAHSVRVSLAAFGIAAVMISYVMSMLFIRIKIPGYLCSAPELAIIKSLGRMRKVKYWQVLLCFLNVLVYLHQIRIQIRTHLD